MLCVYNYKTISMYIYHYKIISMLCVFLQDHFHVVCLQDHFHVVCMRHWKIVHIVTVYTGHSEYLTSVHAVCVYQTTVHPVCVYQTIVHVSMYKTRVRSRFTLCVPDQYLRCVYQTGVHVVDTRYC